MGRKSKYRLELERRLKELNEKYEREEEAREREEEAREREEEAREREFRFKVLQMELEFKAKKLEVENLICRNRQEAGLGSEGVLQNSRFRYKSEAGEGVDYEEVGEGGRQMDRQEGTRLREEQVQCETLQVVRDELSQGKGFVGVLQNARFWDRTDVREESPSIPDEEMNLETEAVGCEMTPERDKLSVEEVKCTILEKLSTAAEVNLEVTDGNNEKSNRSKFEGAIEVQKYVKEWLSLVEECVPGTGTMERVAKEMLMGTERQIMCSSQFLGVSSVVENCERGDTTEGKFGFGTSSELHIQGLRPEESERNCLPYSEKIEIDGDSYEAEKKVGARRRVGNLQKDQEIARRHEGTVPERERKPKVIEGTARGKTARKTSRINFGPATRARGVWNLQRDQEIAKRDKVTTPEKEGEAITAISLPGQGRISAKGPPTNSQLVRGETVGGPRHINLRPRARSVSRQDRGKRNAGGSRLDPRIAEVLLIEDNGRFVDTGQVEKQEVSKERSSGHGDITNPIEQEGGNSTLGLGEMKPEEATGTFCEDGGEREGLSSDDVTRLAKTEGQLGDGDVTIVAELGDDEDSRLIACSAEEDTKKLDLIEGSDVRVRVKEKVNLQGSVKEKSNLQGSVKEKLNLQGVKEENKNSEESGNSKRRSTELGDEQRKAGKTKGDYPQVQGQVNVDLEGEEIHMTSEETMEEKSKEKFTENFGFGHMDKLKGNECRGRVEEHKALFSELGQVLCVGERKNELSWNKDVGKILGNLRAGDKRKKKIKALRSEIRGITFQRVLNEEVIYFRVFAPTYIDGFAKVSEINYWAIVIN